MSRLPLLALAGLLAACATSRPGVTAPTAQGTPATETFAFVARLGADTVAVERVVRSAGALDVDLVVRVPRTIRTRARLDVSPDGQMHSYEAVTTDPATGQEVRRERVIRTGDSVVVRVTGPDGPREQTVAAGPDALPFVEFAHFPFEVALTRGTAGPLPMVTERAVLDFTLDRDGARATVRHPFRGTMAAETDVEGRLLALDGSETTRKLTVSRAGDADVDAAVRRYAALDAEGRGLGPLSGRAEVTATIRGATVTVDHGQPALRGREVWGTVVPWGRVWRTGADRATHLTTTRDLVLGAVEGETLRVPAGAYTLYTVPEPDGGVLVVSRQTGQNGASYDPSQDLGRVTLAAGTLADPVEQLEVAVEAGSEAGSDGRLAVRWGRMELSVPIHVSD